jgi:lipoyl-dependent peroxiredoxin
MPTRTARTTWSGNLTEGGGEVELISSGVGTYRVSFPKRAADDADGTTSPEELIAAAHSSCYAMALSGLLGEADAPARSLEITAEVTLAPDPDGGFRITTSHLTVRGETDDPEAFVRLAEEAKDACPVSKALRGVTISLDAVGA